MKKEFIPYEQALALKELAFDEECIALYKFKKFKYKIKDCNGIVDFYNRDGKIISYLAPTFSQAFRWFREKCSIQSTIEPTKDQHRFELGFNYWIWNTKTAEEWFTEPRDRPAGDYVFDTYEEAELACLEKLIEIVKEQK